MLCDDRLKVSAFCVLIIYTCKGRNKALLCFVVCLVIPRCHLNCLSSVYCIHHIFSETRPYCIVWFAGGPKEKQLVRFWGGDQESSSEIAWVLDRTLNNMFKEMTNNHNDWDTLARRRWIWWQLTNYQGPLALFFLQFLGSSSWSWRTSEDAGGLCFAQLLLLLLHWKRLAKLQDIATAYYSY